MSFITLHYTEKLFVRVNDKDESKFSIVSFQNGESRGFITLIHIITSKFDIVISHYEYELARNLATRSKNQKVYSRFFV